MKQITLKKKGASLTVAGFGKLREGAITPELHAAVVAAHPHLKDEFEIVEVKEEAIKPESKK